MEGHIELVLLKATSWTFPSQVVGLRHRRSSDREQLLLSKRIVGCLCALAPVRRQTLCICRLGHDLRRDIPPSKFRDRSADSTQRDPAPKRRRVPLSDRSKRGEANQTVEMPEVPTCSLV